MAGLRERQKVDRNKRILTAAAELFRRDGYRQMHMEKLAHQAGVSVGTVYNYYATKADILIAIVAMEVEEVLEAGERLLSAPPEPALKALIRLIDHYYDHSLKYLSKEMWRAAMATSIDAPQTPNGIKYNLLDDRLGDQVQRLIHVLQQRGDVSPDLDADVVGSLLFNVLNMLFVKFIKSDDMALDALKAELHEQVEILAHLLTPFEQRVTPRQFGES